MEAPDPRPREPVVRDRLPPERLAVVERLAAVVLFVPLLRAEPVDADDLARLVDVLARLVDDLRAPVEPLLLLRAPPDRELAERPELLLPLLDESSSPVHLPDITRCAASATASAISEPSFEALETTLLAACCAVSAASMPASRIARRAFGLALIAAAAAASPAAIISRLIAALAILSTVLSFDDDDVDVELERADSFDLLELFRLLLFAIAVLPYVWLRKPLHKRNGSAAVLTAMGQTC